MADRRLIIVESPAKAKTLRRFLGPDFDVRASMGHVRDLPQRDLAVDVEHGFKPSYEVVDSRRKVIGELRDAADRVDEVILASDPDREGEAIAWHLAQVLKLRNPLRIEFHEITQHAIKAALASPRRIDMEKVNAQQARRIVDRLVGYKISPYLWRNVQKGLSAGRVQSVALRLVVDREMEIRAFTAEESWTLDALLSQQRKKQTFTARLWRQQGSEERVELRSNAELDQVVAEVEKASWKALSFGRSEKQKHPYLPYITSTLQQDASNRLRLAPKRAMKVAQELYEGVDVGEGGPVGLITYMRTDSTRVADEAERKLFSYIEREFGKQYVGGKRKEKEGVHAQGAHECIRPTDVERTPDKVRSHLSPEQAKLYELIWKRFVASRMAPAKFQVSEAETEAGRWIFRASASVLIFDGFYKVWEREEKEEQPVPELKAGEPLDLHSLNPEQHFSQPPPRYSEASLIKEMEKRGIGRPSTYASIVGTIQERGYVAQKERRLHPTELGEQVTEVLRQHFASIIDDGYTAQIESRLDGIEEGKEEWVPVVSEFYEPLVTMLDAAGKAGPVKTDIQCPECGQGVLVRRTSRYGAFLGCERYPDCTYRRDEKDSGEPAEDLGPCPQCSKPLRKREGKFGAFIGCSGYPDCRYIQPQLLDEACPECGKSLVERNGRFGKFKACSGYPDCTYKPDDGRGGSKSRFGRKPASAGKPTDKQCQQCGAQMLERKGRYGPFLSCSRYPECKGIARIEKDSSDKESSSEDRPKRSSSFRSRAAKPKAKSSLSRRRRSS